VNVLVLYAIVGVAVAAAAWVAWHFWDQTISLIAPFARPYRLMLERSAIHVSEKDLAFRILVTAIAAWGVVVFFYKPAAWLGILALPISFFLTFWVFGLWVKSKIGKRLESFNNQLEIALRLIVSGLRAGLGLRQALVVVVSEMPDPIRTEFNRVLSQTSIGVSVYDALDSLNERMPSAEMMMMTKTIRINAKTGGNLGKVLENLAETIKQRRKIDRKIQVFTSEARASSWVMTGLPIFVGAFILSTQPDMRDSLVGTFVGRIILCIVAACLIIGQVTMNAMAKVDV
jgi:tight adherence protein B